MQSVSNRAFRAALVALLWGLVCLPMWAGRAGCPFAQIFGVPCPGCGMTRAALLFARGEITSSLRMHPLALPSGFVSVALMVATIWVTAKHGTPEAMWRDRAGRTAVLAFVGVEAAVLVLWVVRMLGALGGPVPIG
jgi:hypothetical protein